MIRISSVCARSLSRHERTSQPSSVRSAFNNPRQMSLPILTPDMANKLAMACRRSSNLAAVTRSIVQPVTPVVSARPSPQASPRHSRHSSISIASSPAIRTRTSTASMLNRVIAPFMPNRFVSSRSSDPRGATRVRETVAPGQRPLSSPPAPLAAQQSFQLPTQSTNSQSGSDETAAERVVGNQGLSDFLGRVYATTGYSVVGSLLGSYGLAMLLPATMFTPALIGGLVVSLGSLFAIYQTKPATVRRAGSDMLETTNSSARIVAYTTFVGANSFMLTPLVVMCGAISPLIIPASAGIAGMVMLGSSLYAYRQKSGSLVSWTGPLITALGVTIVLNIGAMGATYFIGANMFSSLMYTIYPYISIGMFSALTAVDTQTAITEYEAGDADHLSHAVSFYLNFVNLLTSIARIISSFTGDRD